MAKIRDKMETRRFLRNLAEARRRYSGFALPLMPPFPWDPSDTGLAEPQDPSDSEEPRDPLDSEEPPEATPEPED